MGTFLEEPHGTAEVATFLLPKTQVETLGTGESFQEWNYQEKMGGVPLWPYVSLKTILGLEFNFLTIHWICSKKNCNQSKRDMHRSPHSAGTSRTIPQLLLAAASESSHPCGPRDNYHQESL